ncbi:MAG: NUDIX hydrolase [archaeon]
MLRRIRVSVLLFEGTQVLVVKMQNDRGCSYVLPGGGLEPGESIYDAAIREVKEETNLDVRIITMGYFKELYTADEEAIDIVLIGERMGGTLRVGYDPEDGPVSRLKDVKFVDAAKLSSLEFHPRQLALRLLSDLQESFKQCPVHLGRFAYPERAT